MRNAKIIAALVLLVSTISVSAQSADEEISCREVSFPSPDGGLVSADLYGAGDHGVVLAHGGIFNKESWRPLATRLAEEGLVALSIDFRGYGKSTAGEQERARYNDVLGAITYLQEMKLKSVSVIGGSMGGGASARAAVETEDDDIDRLILLSPVPIERPDAIRAASILYVVSREERFFDSVVEQHRAAPEPKRLEVLEGDAHAQHIFKSKLGPALTELIVEFLHDDVER